MWIRVKPNKYVWLIKLTILLTIIILGINACSYFIKNNNHTRIAMLTLGVGLPLIVAAKLLSRKNRILSNQIDELIWSNRLCYTDDRGSYYPIIWFRRNKTANTIDIKVRLDGTPETERFKELEHALEGLLKLSCVESYETRGYQIMSYEREQPKAMTVRMEDEITIANKDEIRISERITWDFRKVPHLLITGITGSGKTTLACWVIKSLVSQGVRVIYCDPKNDLSMKNFIDSLPTARYVSGIGEILDDITSIEKEMRDRQNELEKVGVDEYDFEPIYLIVDELVAYQKISDRNTYNTATRLIGSIVTMGRGKRVYCGLIMQRPDTSFIDGVTRENLGCRIAMGQQSSTAYEMIFGEEFRKVKNRNRQIGSGLIYRTAVDSRPREFIAPYVTD